MQWVETTGKSVDEAKGLALDQLGVAEDDAEFEIVAEPKTGLFGRLKIEARVRARVKPTNVRPKLDNRDRRRSRDEAKAAAKAAKSNNGDAVEVPSAEKPKSQRPAQKPKTGGQSARQQQPQRDDVETRAEKPKKSQPVREESQVSAQQVGEEATKFMAELVTAFGLSGTVSLKEDGDDLEVRVDGEDLGLMVGPRGNTLQSIQDLARVAAQRRLGDHDTRLRVDVGGYRERRREALGRFAAQIAAQVAETGSARALEPMSSADRKVIHDFLTEHEGVVTRSEGDDPNRRVVIAPANA